jgi:hypothetical protein
MRVQGGGWWVENVRAELDSWDEFFYDVPTKTLYLFFNASCEWFERAVRCHCVRLRTTCAVRSSLFLLVFVNADTESGPAQAPPPADLELYAAQVRARE